MASWKFLQHFFGRKHQQKFPAWQTRRMASGKPNWMKQVATSRHSGLRFSGQGETQEEARCDHDKNLVALLQRAREVNLKLNPKQLKLILNEVPYIGHLLTPDGVKPDPGKCACGERLLGFVNYLAKFVPHLVVESEHLRRLIDKDAEWIWEKHHQDAFDRIKKLVASHPILCYYDVSKPVSIQCDSSETGLGAALLQDGQPVAFASRTLTPTERGYAQIEKGCLAIVFSCDRFNQYIYGRESVDVQSDHKPLEATFVKPLTAAPKRRRHVTPFSESGPTWNCLRPEKEDVCLVDVEQINASEFIRVLVDGLRSIQRETEAEQGEQACLRRARGALFWPDMSQQVQNLVSSCSLCAEFAPAQAKEPLMTPELPKPPWSVIAQDLYSLGGKDFLITVDAYSGFCEVGKIPQTTAADCKDIT
ncbi:Hypothetical predicted protein [Paramuricea clavata]|uniref:Reverse transcriptase/retrotransposon-derived protein RNase H-like domain-containing protein n=1 Tax=Paramuricea clavata TaxID=317549 RepID=A0A6S7KEM4_PARCT|nr:Hypothetical predicted protein [Paramuricea clavata]